MESKVHNLLLDIDWKLINTISEIDRFDASWTSIERKEGQSLKQLKTIATVRSVGASTRIEGSNMSDAEVEILLKDINISKLEDRDSQEVVGYFETIDIITESYQDITIDRNSLKNLHSILLKHSQKDQWHKGDYKQHSNAVEANYPDGTKKIIFQTTEPGFATEDAMNSMFEWYKNDQETHPLVKSALFSYEFVSIHPFQDGNGRLSRLLASLLLLQNGYKWIQYVSLEHEIESRKNEYYRVLRSCQSNRPNENITELINFFFSAILNIQKQLIEKLESTGAETQLSSREKSILLFIEDRPGCQSGEIAQRLNIPNPTVKRILSEFVSKNMINKHASGRKTNYTLS